MTPIHNIGTTVAVKTIASGTNILYSLQALVCRINAQLSRLSQETQSRSQTMKKEYRVATDKSAMLTKKMGEIAPIFSSIALCGAGAVGFVSTQLTEGMKPFQDKMAMAMPLFVLMKEFTPSVQTYMSQSLDAKRSLENSVSSLRQTEIQNESNKSGEARDLQSQLDSILANVRDLFKKAAG